MASVPQLSDLKQYLRYTTGNTSDDVALQEFLAGSIGALEAEVDKITPTQFTENYDGGDFQIRLRNYPIISIENIEEGWGFTNYELTEVPVNSPSTANMFAFSVDDIDTGLITRRSGGNVNIPFMHGSANIQVAYTAGRPVISDNLRLAILTLAAIWWRGAQQRAAGAGTGTGFTAINVDFPRSGADIYTPINQGVPNFILEMIKGDRRFPIIG